VGLLLVDDGPQFGDGGEELVGLPAEEVVVGPQGLVLGPEGGDVGGGIGRGGHADRTPERPGLLHEIWNYF
jgi:hypothetical protein